jgi:cytochrome c oxidase subunit 4
MTETAVSEHVDPEAEGSGHGIGAKGHPSDGQYIVVALVLALITAVEVAVYYITSIPKHLLTVMLLAMSAVKFTAVVLWFMHLRFDSRMFRRLFVTGLVLAFAVMIVFMSTLHFYSPSRR